MKLTSLILLVPIFLASCSTHMPDPVIDFASLSTGRPTVMSRSNDMAGIFASVSTVESLARQHSGRAAFEAAVMQRVVTGELAVNELSVTYEDNTIRSFK